MIGGGTDEVNDPTRMDIGTAEVSETDGIDISHEETTWCCCGNDMKKGQAVFFAQIFVLYTIIAVSLIMLCLQNGNSDMWIALLCSAFGSLMPNPSYENDINTP